MKLKILETALETIRALRPVMLRIRREDRGLHRQMTEAMNSLVLNLSEGEYSDPGTRKARFHSACGSANEVRGGVLAAQAWGYVPGGFAATRGPTPARNERSRSFGPRSASRCSLI